MRSFYAGLVLLALWPSAAHGQAAAGAEFRVNSYTTAAQYRQAVACDANGNFVVVWNSYGQDGSNWGIFGQRFNVLGTPQGSEFRVNSYTTDVQVLPHVASDPNGNFVVVWQDQDGSASGVFGRRFNAFGAPLGTEFRVNSYTTSVQRRAAVVAAANGSFVVVWASGGQDGSSEGIFGQRFNAAGVPQGAEFLVNSHTAAIQTYPALALDANGNFVVVWQGSAQDGDGYGVFGQRFDASGTAQGSEFQVNTYTTFDQHRPSVASDATGDFFAIWQGGGQDGSGFGVFGQRFNSSGVPQGSEFRVNTYTTYVQYAPTVASDANGNFVVVWNSYSNQDGSGSGIFAQRYDSTGALNGAEFRVSSYTTNEQVLPTVASDPDGRFVVAWGSQGQDGSLYGVFAQRYGDLIFRDGFETGGLNRWSSSATDGGDLSVSGAAAMAGTSFGLQALVDDLNGIFVQDDTPAAENRLRGRFYFDPNGFDPGEADSHFRTRIFIAFDPSNQRVITVVLKRQGGAYSVQGRVRLNDGTRADTGFFAISDGPHFFEFDWQRASAPAAGNGTFNLWIDDTLRSTLTGLDNDLSPVEFVRMGAFSVKTAAAGTLYFDQFESRRETFIGAE